MNWEQRLIEYVIERFDDRPLTTTGIIVVAWFGGCGVLIFVVAFAAVWLSAR